jgi:molecular chaperone GrpE
MRKVLWGKADDKVKKKDTEQEQNADSLSEEIASTPRESAVEEEKFGAAGSVSERLAAKARSVFGPRTEAFEDEFSQVQGLFQARNNAEQVKPAEEENVEVESVEQEAQVGEKEPTVEEIMSKLGEAVEGSKLEAAENYDKYLRTVAELENYKKRVLRERADLIRYAGEHLARDLVDVVDDLERAAAQTSSVKAENVIEGVRMIRDRVVALLEKHSIKSEDVVGSQFDPNKLEAIASVPSDKYPAGTVIEQLRKPYMFKDKLLRPGQVVVSKSPGNDETKSGGSEEEAGEEPSLQEGDCDSE